MLNLIPYPSIPNSSSLGNFFIVEFMIQQFLMSPFTTLPTSQYTGIFLDQLVGNFLFYERKTPISGEIPHQVRYYRRPITSRGFSKNWVFSFIT